MYRNMFEFLIRSRCLWVELLYNKMKIGIEILLLKLLKQFESDFWIKQKILF